MHKEEGSHNIFKCSFIVRDISGWTLMHLGTRASSTGKGVWRGGEGELSTESLGRKPL